MSANTRTISTNGKIPPDGGWGWAVVCGTGLYNSIYYSTLKCFGLIYRDKFEQIAMSATDVTFLINFNSALGMCFGLFSAPLINRFGYRTVAVTGGSSFAIGVALASFSHNFWTFFLSFGMMQALGFGMCSTSFQLAFNSYFLKKRNKAAGISATINGIGPVIYPALITMLIGAYGGNGCILILAGISAHIIVCACLLQPIKWHYKIDALTVDRSAELALHSTAIDARKSDENRNKSALLKGLQWIRQTFDLDLLRDKIYINIMVGMSLTIFVEINFVMLMPFMLADMDYTMVEVASLMSILAIVDISFRFVSPFVGDYFKLGPRVMFLLSLAVLTVTRVAIMLVHTYRDVLLLLVVYGIAKGVRIVYISLVVPSHVPIDRLASATGIQMVTNGLIMVVLGPFVGIVRDMFGHYKYCIWLITVFSIVAFLMWTIEMLYVHRRDKRKKEKEQSDHSEEDT